MGRKSFKIIIVFVIFLFIQLIYPIEAYAESEEDVLESSPASGQSCNSLDIIFIIDQSGSMGGYGSYPPNDPDGQRKFAVDWAIDWMADNAYDVCPDAVHRVSIISFGTHFEVDLEMQVINPGNTEEWEFIRDTLKEDVQLKDMDYTNPLGAFIKAKMLFDEYPPEGDIIPKRVIIFMTDGQPDPETSNVRYLDYTKLMKKWIDGEVEYYHDQENIKDLFLIKNDSGLIAQGELPKNYLEGIPFDSSLFDLELCLDIQRQTYGDNIPSEEINECFEDNRVSDDAYINSTYIYTMLLSHDTSWPESIRNVFEDISTSHAGDTYNIIDNKQEIPGTFLDIFTELSGVEVTRLACENFAVNPFVSQARLTFFKINPDDETRIYYTDDQGVDHQITSNDRSSPGFDVLEYLPGSNERFVLNNPYPGIWRIEADSCDGIDAYYESVEIDVSSGLNPVRIWNETEGYQLPEGLDLPEYDVEPFHNTDKEFFLTFELTDIEGNVLERIPNSNIVVDAKASVSLPNGSNDIYPMSWDADLLKYRTDQPLQLPLPGLYEFSVVGEVPYREIPYGPIESQKYEDVFVDTLSLFKVEDLSFNIFEVLPIEVQANVEAKTIHNNFFQNKFKWPLSITPINVYVTYSEENDTQIKSIKDIFIEPDNSVWAYWQQGENKSKAVALAYDPDFPERLSGELLPCDLEGPVNIIVETQGEYTEQFRFLEKNSSVMIDRSDTIWTNPITYQVLFWLFILIIVLFIVRCLINRRHPVDGKVELVAAGGEPYEFYLSGRFCHKNKAVIKKALVETQEYSDLYRVEVFSVPKVKLPKSQEDEYDDGLLDTFGSNAYSGNTSHLDDEIEEKSEVKIKLWLISKQKPIQNMIAGKPDVEMNLQTGDQRPYSDMAATEIRFL